MLTIRAVRTSVVVATLLLTTVVTAQEPPPWQAFLAAGSSDRGVSEQALDAIEAPWRDGYTAMLIDVARFLPSPQAVGADEAGDLDGGTARQLLAAEARRRITRFLERRTGQRHGDDLRAWRRWMWRLPYEPHPAYAAFKADLYARVDPAFARFFASDAPARIRLDEIDWGGVPVNGIPPLRHSPVVTAAAAGWLRDSHLVFGLEVNGEARAYPKRILAWHELATDTLGGVDLAIVYCTLCGTVVPYESSVDGRRLTFGTSGLLYRSNKLMFDEETSSLWSSMEGVPVVGAMTSRDIRLVVRPVVTTTWGEWRRRHPTTTVLSIETGHDRDYGEGAAYRDYFANDRLMFEVPTIDRRLKNKDEVLVLRPGVVAPGSPPVAIAAARLSRDPLYALDVAGRALVVVTSRGGANRVYERGSRAFTARGDESAGSLVDAEGTTWRVLEDALVSGSGERLRRVEAHRAFWFGWVAQHPQTELHR